ncbi:L-fucose/L-arabinose isomerase family protein [Terrabacter aeriphilus]|uniref:L-fucose/L-arabinose isomerase family protein n=1 Tax=Terrabacter aeriphilus TaxID=515662 RepID=A0ABP9JH31_9MICO
MTGTLDQPLAARTDGAAPVRVLLVPTARPTFAVDVARTLAAEARALLVELGAEVVGPDDLVMTPEDVVAARPFVDAGADLVVNVCASFSDATPALELYGDLEQPVLLWSFREPGPVGDRLWLNSMCGANLFGHALVVHAGRTPRFLYGDPGEPGTRATLRDALAGDLPPVVPLPATRGDRAEASEGSDVVRGLESLRGRRLGLVGDAPPGFTPSQYDGDLLQRLFGIEVEQVDVDAMFGQVAAVSDDTARTEHAAALAAQPSLAQVDGDQALTSARITSAMRDWRDRDSLSGMAIRCWPEFPTQLGACPCSSLSRVADDGTPTACERDVYGAVTMLLMEALGSGTTYLVDTVDLEAADNVVRLWHCGAAATSLAADPEAATQSTHCNRKLGVAGNFPLRTGRVVMARLTEDPSRPGGLRLLLAAGESLPEPNRFQGNTAAVRVDGDASALVTGLVTGGFPHHTVLAWTDVRPQLRAAADRLGITVVDW